MSQLEWSPSLLDLAQTFAAQAAGIAASR